MESKSATNSDLKIYLRLLSYMKPFIGYFVIAIIGMGLYAWA